MADVPPQPPKPPQNLWLAVLPGLLVFSAATGMFIRSSMDTRAAASALTQPAPLEQPASSGKPAENELLQCVEVYGVTMHTSEDYVPERGGYATARRKNAPNYISTVLRGMMRNNCGRPLPRVEAQLEVTADDGATGLGWVAAGNLAAGQGGSFEKAWMGRVTSYKVVRVR